MVEALGGPFSTLAPLGVRSGEAAAVRGFWAIGNCNSQNYERTAL